MGGAVVSTNPVDHIGVNVPFDVAAYLNDRVNWAGLLERLHDRGDTPPRVLAVVSALRLGASVGRDELRDTAQSRDTSRAAVALSVADIATEIGRTKNTVLAAIKAGDLAAEMVDGRYEITRPEAERWKNARSKS